jgi:medium-chain acyl-[acyl-carrier-protein] hydrolase
MGATSLIVTRNPWVSFPRPNAQARLRFFCFPYAGGAASAFYNWPAELPNYVEVCPIQLPGRENRMSEPPTMDLLALVQSLFDGIMPLLDKPFVFFGHSMGAIISFELARRLRRLGRPLPLHLFASGSRAPQFPETEITYNLPELELVETLKRLNGTPVEVLGNPAWRKAFLPLVRADLAIDETYMYYADAPLDCPITVFGGTDDKEVLLEELEGWRSQTRSAFSLSIFSGDHFFLRTSRKPLLRAISKELASVTRDRILSPVRKPHV